MDLVPLTSCIPCRADMAGGMRQQAKRRAVREIPTELLRECTSEKTVRLARGTNDVLTQPHCAPIKQAVLHSIDYVDIECGQHALPYFFNSKLKIIQ